MTIEIYFIAIVVAIACAIPGVFLVLRGMTMLSDAITHTVLLGIVLAFFMTEDLNSPFLIIGATFIGILTVWLIEMLQRTELLKKDAAIGIVFPLFFSIAIILITRFAGDIHLDVDSVLMGEITFAPFNRFVIFGQDIGPKALVVMVPILLLNILFVLVHYKELKITTFDPTFSMSIGFSPLIIHYGLMSLVSLTAVGAYDAVGSVLVVGFMVGPALTGYLLSTDLLKILFIAVGAAVMNSILGVAGAFLLDTSIAGMIATITGLTAFLAFIFSPKDGWIKQWIQERKLKKNFYKKVAQFKK